MNQGDAQEGLDEGLDKWPDKQIIPPKKGTGHQPNSWETGIKANLKAFLWVLCGATITASIHISAWMEVGIGILSLESISMASLFFTPAFCGFVIGMLYYNHSLQTCIYASFGMTVLSLLFIVLVFTVPILIGVAEAFGVFTNYILTRVLVSSLLIFPATLISVVIGKINGEIIFGGTYAGERMRLRMETQEWHRILERMEEEERLGDRELIKGSMDTETADTRESDGEK